MPDHTSRPQQQDPPVQRLRLRYAKRGRMRFTSHRDFSRAFERAVFRARIPMAYSSGFHPHPRISYAGAAPTGAASEAEYCELALARVCDPEIVRADLDEALPGGLDVIEVVVAASGSFAERLEASHWRVQLPGVSLEAARSAANGLLAATEATVQRMTKKGLRTFDVRAAIMCLDVDPHPDEPEGSPKPVSADPSPAARPHPGTPAALSHLDGPPARLRHSALPAHPSGDARDGDDRRIQAPCAILDLVLRHGTPAVRPDDVLAALRDGGLSVPVAALAQRRAQGPLERDGTVGDPLSPDRDAGRSPAK